MSSVTGLARLRDEYCLFIWEISARSTGMKSTKHNQNGGTHTCIVRACRSFTDSCNFTNAAYSHAFEVEIHTRQKLCHFGRNAAKPKVFCPKHFVSVTRAVVFTWGKFSSRLPKYRRKNRDLVFSRVFSGFFFTRKGWRGKISET